MLLAIDIGNTNIVIGLIEGNMILHQARIATDPLKTSDQYSMDLINTLSLYALSREQIDDVIISSVVPPVLNSLRTAATKLTGKAPLVVGPGIKTGLNIKMEDPSQLGSDLVVTAVAALKQWKPPLIIIDMGTATTFSAIDPSGAYVGGSISTGVKISSNALTGNTAQLPGISLDAPKKAIGRNTVEAMRSGLMLGTACMLDGMIDRYREELGENATVIATGGIAKFVLPMCRREIRYDRDLLLKGLITIYEYNKKK